MRHFPLFLRLEDARVVLVGGGEQIARKARLLSRTHARLDIMAAELTAELRGVVAAGRAAHIPALLDPAGLAGARLVVVSTGCAALDAVAADLARSGGALVNVVDRPALSDAIMPAIVDRDPVVVAIGTEGTAPVLARRIKTALETALEPGLGRFATLAGALRGRVAARVAPDERRRFWEWACELPRRLFAEGRDAEAMGAIDAALETGAAPGTAAGRISLVGTGSGAADLLTLRAVERLQGADLILHDADCPRSILDLARRDADRLVLEAGAPAAWHAVRAARTAKAEAAEGRRVVWLGDGTEAAWALDRAGTPFERVPGVQLVALALAEDGRADADMRGAERNGALEVAAHAHGQA